MSENIRRVEDAGQALGELKVIRAMTQSQRARLACEIYYYWERDRLEAGETIRTLLAMLLDEQEARAQSENLAETLEAVVRATSSLRSKS